jgi:hypothetical protein
MSAENERPLAGADRGPECRRPLRLQAQEDARRFENCGFPATVRGNDEIEAASKFNRARLKAAEVSKLEIAEHDGLIA